MFIRIFVYMFIYIKNSRNSLFQMKTIIQLSKNFLDIVLNLIKCREYI